MENKTIITNTEVLEVDSSTGEIIINADKKDLDLIKQTKIKAVNILNENDFVKINGTWEAKRDGLMKILSSLPINYIWEIKERMIDHNIGYSEIVGVLIVKMYRDWETDRKSTRLNSSHRSLSRMPSSA